MYITVICFTVLCFTVLCQIASTAPRCTPNCLSPHTCCSHFGSKVECDKATENFPIRQSHGHSHGHSHCNVEKIRKIAFNNCPPTLKFNRTAFNLQFDTVQQKHLWISFENVGGCTTKCLDYTSWTGLRLINGRVCKGELFFKEGEGWE
jgi:hypothetical protein